MCSGGPPRIASLVIDDSSSRVLLTDDQLELRYTFEEIQIEPDSVLPLEKELTNTVSMAKDGKACFDPNKSPGLLRK
jgi:hypothetical protein